MTGPSSSRKTLIALSIAAACASSAPAFAATTIVVERSLPPQVKVSNTEFDVNERTGSARLSVDFYDDTWDGYLSSESVVVPGLRFDRERREVLYENGDSVVTCARPRKILWGTSYPATGACRIIVRSEPRTADAGSSVHALTNWVVELVTDTPSKAASLSKRSNPE